jgi:hypothetical protein
MRDVIFVISIEAHSGWEIVSLILTILYRSSSLPTSLTNYLEIGLSESARKLAIDARGWLETVGSTVQLVIAAKISRDSPEIIIQLWELQPRSYSIRTRASPPSAKCTKEIWLSRMNNRTVVSDSLTLPFEKVVGRAAKKNFAGKRLHYFLAGF